MNPTALLLALSLFAQQPTESPIVLDGTFDDWEEIEPAVSDAADAAQSQIDFRDVRVTHDSDYVYLHIDFGNVVNVQALEGRALLLLDVDGKPRTGQSMLGVDGVDVAIEFTPVNDRRPDRPGRGTGVQSATYQPDPDNPDAKKLSTYDIGLMMSPTYASREVEFRIERGSRLHRSPAMFTGGTFSGALAFLNPGGDVLDRTDAFTYELSEAEAHSSRSQDDDPLTREAATDLRVVSWNAEHGGMIESPEPFSRMLSAVQPDVVLWQELTDKNSADQIAAWMNEHVASTETNTEARWHVVFGEGGGPLRTAVASRYPIQSVRELHMLPYRDIPDREVRVSGAAVRVAGKTLLAVSAHLKCCGAMDTREDRLRFVEARMINDAVRDALRAGPYDGVVIAGDLNLVGERNVKVVLGNALDNNDSLAVGDAMQLCGTNNTTWAQPGMPFLPSRLDYMLYAQSRLKLNKSFVLDSSDLVKKWQEHHDVRSGDSADASDHAPVVADFTWKDG